jgi:hypothetical protein
MLRRVAVWLLLAPVGTVASAAVEVDYEVLQPSLDVTQRQNFGNSVARVEGLVVVGSPGDQETAPNAGAAYTFERDGEVWRESKLVPTDGSDGDRAGIEVAIAGDRAVLASYHNNARGPLSGAVYVFRREDAGWIQEAKLLGSALDEGDWMGLSIAAQGDEILAGAPYGGNQRQVPGTVYAFRRSGTQWHEVQNFTAADAVPGDRFGSEVAIAGDIAVVRSNGLWAPSTFQRGVVYVFRRGESGWAEEAKLLPTAIGGSFGSLAVHGDRILLGASGERTFSGGAVGAAHVYRYDGTAWTEEAALFASDGVNGDRFGAEVAIWRDIALVRARTDADAPDAGTIYLFRFDGEGWVEVAELLAPPPPTDAFGVRVRLGEGGLAISGSRGRAYLIDLRDRVSVDIAPWHDPNRIDPLSRLGIFVAVLGADGFEAGSIVPESLRFGPAGAQPSPRPISLRLDVNRDGHRHLVSRFVARETGIAFGDTEACVEGRTEGSLPFAGCDAVETVPRCGGGVELALVAPPIVSLWRRHRGRRTGGSRR